ncbi:hypothetical protein ETB97_004252 [Aspergillus alliaceus]|uniref:Uncharacterized protein n=1 Tax=Petromyces alliaceus TaxID=209559 RepID=A0A8H6A383_PETAA|nr:hypothetical protein ETB97_004252 [Aspergillus burnettii]
MARVLSETSQFRQQSQPKTDYERWLEEEHQSYSLAENPGHRPAVPAMEDRNPVFHRVLNDGPRKKIHDAHSSAMPRPVDRPHGGFLARPSTTSHASLKDVITEALQEHCLYQWALLLALFIALIYGVKTLKKRHRRAITLPISESAESISTVINAKMQLV